MKKILFRIRSLIFSGLILSCPFFSLFAQDELVPVITRPSSEALALEKYGEIPTDLYTGRVNIDIPLLNITEHNIEIPIKINYFGGGIKVMEDDGPIGLGWTLCLGGMISRSVCGMPDEMYDPTLNVVGYNRLEELFSYTSMNDRREFVELIKNRTFDYNPADQYRMINNYCKIGYMSSHYGKQYDQGHFDTAQDTYSFNFMGMSGVFVMDKNGYYTGIGLLTMAGK